MQRILNFLAHLHRGGTYAYYHALPDRRSWWYEVDSPLCPPEECTTNWYFSIHPTTEVPPTNAHGEPRTPAYVRSQKKYIAAINCLFAEFDEKDYGSKEAIHEHLDALCIPDPSMIVESGGGAHVYWLLKDTFHIETDDQREAARIIQELWVSVVGGDPGAKDLTRILRIPGTLNFKYDPPRPVQFLKAELEQTYTLQALTAHLPAIGTKPKRHTMFERATDITDFNEHMPIGDVLAQRGYSWKGRTKMLSPWSSTGCPGVTIDADTNRAFVHHGSDPLCDGYWKRPFEVVRILDHQGDFHAALAAIKRGA
jgi:hypothetical protein